MIINVAKVRPEYAMRQDEAQMVLDFESLMVRLGLEYFLQCRVCHLRADLGGGTVVADFTKDGAIYTLRLSCDCSSHVYRGDGLTPTRPPMDAPIVAREDATGPKALRVLTRPEMFIFDAMGQLLTNVLKMRYWMRCLRCQNENQADGVRGAAESTSGMVVVECACTRRVYEGHDAPVVAH